MFHIKLKITIETWIVGVDIMNDWTTATVTIQNGNMRCHCNFSPNSKGTAISDRTENSIKIWVCICKKYINVWTCRMLTFWVRSEKVKTIQCLSCCPEVSTHLAHIVCMVRDAPVCVTVCVCVRQVRGIGSGQKNKEEDRENPQQLSPKWRQIHVKSKEHQLTGPTSAVCVKSPAQAWTYSNVHCGVRNEAGTSALSSFTNNGGKSAP